MFKLMAFVLILGCAILFTMAISLVNEKNSSEQFYFENRPPSYSWDQRTNLCFAIKDYFTSSALLTNVPCTDAVIALINKK